MAASPSRRCHRDDDFPHSLNRRSSPVPSSDAEADRGRRCSSLPRPTPTAAADADPRPSGHDRRSMARGGDADDRPPRRDRVSGREEGCDSKGRRARVSDDEMEDGRWRRRSRASDDGDDDRGKRIRDRDSHHRRRRHRSPSTESGSLPDDRRSRRRRRDERSRLHDDRGERRRSPEKREPETMVPGCTGGHYIPPFLAHMLPEVEDKTSPEFQRRSWDTLKNSINGLISKVNATNIKNTARKLFAKNLVRGRGLFCQSCIKSQMASPEFTDVIAALVAAVNTKIPEIGRLLLVRVMLEFKRAYARNDKPQLLAATKFLAHLVNQLVTREFVALELLTVLLEKPTSDSVEVAVEFVKECGATLQASYPQRLHAIFRRFQDILHEGEIDKSVQFLIKGLFAIRKAKFEGYPAKLDLVQQKDQFTHVISLEDELDPETNLNVFRESPNFINHEEVYESIKRSILGSEHSLDDAESDEEKQMETRDKTDANLWRTIYLAIKLSVKYEEAGLMKIQPKPGQEMELCRMIIYCCSEERTYLRSYGLLGQRYCMINKVYQESFEKCFLEQFSGYGVDLTMSGKVAKFFAHLLETDTLPWRVFANIRLTNIGSDALIFMRTIFEDLWDHLGIRLLERLNDPRMQGIFESIFPEAYRKTIMDPNFKLDALDIAIGGHRQSLREFFKNMQLFMLQQHKPEPSGPESISESLRPAQGLVPTSESKKL
ncbi:hypothetical protein ACP70R_024100 [Stipagrostis hirtigluma subsp. patula]